MRLTCPNCGTQYQIDDELIPPEGRAVECAGCGHGWHQPGLDADPILLGDADLAREGDAPPAEVAAPPRHSAAVLDILREEAQRELTQRAADRARGRQSATVASGDDVGLRGAGADADPPAAAMPHDPDLETEVEDVADEGPDRFEPAEPDRPEFVVAELVEVDDDHRPLPNPHALAASLHWTEPQSVPAQPPQARQPDGERQPVRRRRGGYGAGFVLALCLGVIVGGAYVAAPREGAGADAGAIGQGLSAYREGADRLRLRLHDLVAPAPGADPTPR